MESKLQYFSPIVDLVLPYHHDEKKTLARDHYSH